MLVPISARPALLKVRASCCTNLAWGQSVVSNDAPRDFGPEVTVGAKFQIPVARQCGREMSAPRSFETDPFHPLGSICNIKELPYICKNLPVISSMWDAQV